MFANFEICRAGLIQAEIKHRQPRSTTGCLQCRRRKKKCDEKLPICDGCLRTGDSTNPKCTRPTRSPSPSLGGASSTPCLREESPSPSVQTLVPCMSTTFSSDASLLSHASSITGGQLGEVGRPTSIHSAGQDGAEQICRSFAYDTWPITTLPIMNPQPSLESSLLKAFSRPEERKALQSLTSRFDPMTTLTYINPRFSILAQGLPLAVEYPAIKDAFVACGLGILFRISSKQDYYQLSGKYYNQAINTVASQLMSLPEEPNLAAVLLLHIFEEMLCDTVAPKRIHMMGAHSLVMSAFSLRPPSTVHQNLLLEAYIYHVVISNMFSGIKSAPPPDNYISDLLCVLARSSERICAGPMWKMSAMLGSSHEVFDLSFRISQLRRRLPLQGSDLATASCLEQLLNYSESLVPLGSLKAEPQDTPPLEMTLTTQLYKLACMILLQKLQNPTVNAADELPRSIFQQARLVLSQLPKSERRSGMLIWPLLILGCAAITPAERAEFCAPFEDCIRDKWMGSATQAYQFLMKAWEFDISMGRELGFDILLADDLVSKVFL